MQRCDTEIQAFTLENFPLDLLFSFFIYLNLSDLINLTLVNKKFFKLIMGKTTIDNTKNNVSNNANILWNYKLNQHFPESKKIIIGSRAISTSKSTSISSYIKFIQEYKSLNVKPIKFFAAWKEGNLQVLKEYRLTFPMIYKNLNYLYAVSNKYQNVLDYFYKAIILPFFSAETITYPVATEDKIKNKTLLWWAICCNQSIEIIKDLIINKEDKMEIKVNEKMNPLHLAAKLGYATLCEQLINNQLVDIDSQDVFGCTPLHWAAKEGHVGVIKILLTKQSKTDIQSYFSQDIPLIVAIKSVQIPAAKMLNTIKKDVNLLSSTDYNNLSFVMLAKGYIESVKFLIEIKNEIVNIKNNRNFFYYIMLWKKKK